MDYSDKNIKKISKQLSLVLRHKPEEIKLTLDNEGWADVNELLTKMGNKFQTVPMDLLELVVETNDKKRFAFNEHHSKIRASQGHSIKVDLNFKSITPPPVLFHGTVDKFIESINQNGLIKGQRQHVHLSDNLETARNVGSRRGKAIILKVEALKMHQSGFEFYQSENGVWLTDHVPSEYIIN